MTPDGKVVIVTGAAHGIGQEYARAGANVGARVVVTDINDCGETLDSVKAAGGDAITVKVDVSDRRATDAMVAAAVKAFDRVDGLNNAALYAKLRGGRFDAISEADTQPWRSMSRASGTAASQRCLRCADPAAAASSTSLRSLQPTAWLTRSITRPRKRQSSA
jgi:NAD(P)-dependent dehydrogenase (short-subunit alcohol dehydrogenase family)